MKVSKSLKVIGSLILIFCSLAAHAAPTRATCQGSKIYISGNKVFWENVSSGDPLTVYPGKYKPTGIIACGTGVVTTFRVDDDKDKPKDHAYYSPNCENVGGGGDTEKVYNGDQIIVSLSQPADKKGIIVRWRHSSGNERSYFSPDCKNIGGGGNTTRQ